MKTINCYKFKKLERKNDIWSDDIIVYTYVKGENSINRKSCVH